LNAGIIFDATSCHTKPHCNINNSIAEPGNEHLKSYGSPINSKNRIKINKKVVTPCKDIFAVLPPNTIPIFLLEPVFPKSAVLIGNTQSKTKK
jgi:hypothetical protein